MEVLQENIKVLEYPNNYSKTIYFKDVPLNKFFVGFRKIDIMNHKSNKGENEIFLSIETKSGRFYYYAEMTNGLKEWLRRNTFTGCGGIEIIQQRESGTTEQIFTNEFLVVAEESSIIGNLYLDYKDKVEIEDFFKIKVG